MAIHKLKKEKQSLLKYTKHKIKFLLHIQVHLKKDYIMKKFIFYCNLFKKVKLSNILDS